MNWFTGLKIALLGVITAALVACGAVPSDGASPTDANHTDAAVDRPAPTPDVFVTPDNPTPPPPDAMQIAPDLPPPPPDAPTEDASVPPMDATPSPPDATVEPDAPPPPPDVMSGSMEGAGETINGFSWRIHGTTVCDVIIYKGGSVYIGGELRIGLSSRYSNGVCVSRIMSCVCPSEGTPDALVLRGLRPGMTEMEAVSNGTIYTLEAVTRCR